MHYVLSEYAALCSFVVVSATLQWLLNTSLSSVCLPHRTCKMTRVWGPDCRASGCLCRRTAAWASCTWAPSTQSEGTWLSVQRLAGSCRAVASLSPADLKYGDEEVSFYDCRWRGDEKVALSVEDLEGWQREGEKKSRICCLCPWIACNFNEGLVPKVLCNVNSHCSTLCFL